MQKEKNGRARKIVLSAFAAEARKARRRTDLKNFRDDLILTVWNSVFKFAFPRPVVSHNNFAIVSISNDSPEYVYLAFYFGWLVCWLLGRLDAWLFGWYFSRLRGILEINSVSLLFALLPLHDYISSFEKMFNWLIPNYSFFKIHFVLLSDSFRFRFISLCVFFFCCHSLNECFPVTSTRACM